MGSSRNGRTSGATNGNGKTKRVALSAEEVAAVLAACRRYRHTIPVYLASKQAELTVLDAVMRKLR